MSTSSTEPVRAKTRMVYDATLRTPLFHSIFGFAFRQGTAGVGKDLAGEVRIVERKKRRKTQCNQKVGQR